MTAVAAAAPSGGSPATTTPPLITRWDLDKTYLRSDFERLGDLARSLLERPDQKRAVPGAATLLRLLGQARARVHVLSGSPRQMRGAILQRFAMDGVRVDQLTLKPNASNLLRLRWRALKDQLGYKLPAMLEARVEELDQLGTSPPEVLVGDDSEGDAFVYSLYADVCSGAVSLPLLEQVLTIGQAYKDVKRRTLQLGARILERAPLGPVHILVHLERQSPPSRFAAFAPRLVPFHNYVQASLLLCEWRYLDAGAVFALCQEMLALHRFDQDAIARSYLDLVRRGHVTGVALAELERVGAQAPPELLELPAHLRSALDATGASLPPRAPARREPAPPLDYLALALEHRGGRGRH